LAFLADAPQEDGRSLAGLVNRLSSRLGREAVVRSQLSNDPQPEHAYEDTPLTEPPAAGRRVAAEKSGSPPGALRRPLLLYHPPRPLQVVAIVPDGPPIRGRHGDLAFEVTHYWGPERVETGWWRGPTVRRDYYRVESSQGTRFWLFRRWPDGQWFLQGEFG
jgi:protein ImuB